MAVAAATPSLRLVKVQRADDMHSGMPKTRRVSSVMTCGRYGGTRADHGAIGEHRRERKHVVAHGSIAHRGRAGGARGCHTPERGVRTRIDGEEEPVAREALIERHTAHPCLNDDQQVIGADIEDRVHLRQVQAHAAVDRQHMPFQG